MGFTRKPPTRNCFRDLLIAMNPNEFQAVVNAWVESLELPHSGDSLQAVSIDGKTLCDTLTSTTVLNDSLDWPDVGQWEIENGLYWICDVTLGEDASRIRTGDAPQNLAAIRSAIISCFRIEKIENIAATLREYTWNPQRLFEKLGRWIN